MISTTEFDLNKSRGNSDLEAALFTASYICGRLSESELYSDLKKVTNVLEGLVQKELKSVPVAENVVAGDGMKSKEDILKKLSSGDMSGFNFIEGDLIPYEIVLEAMETYASQFKNQPTDDELWGKLLYYVKHSNLDELKSKFKITRR